MLSDLFYRFRALFHRKAVEIELDEELQYHLDREAEKYRQAGASPEDAMRRARLAIGGPEQVRQQCREAHGIRLFDDLLQDLRYGIRTLGKSPGFTVVMVLTLALGIGACTAIFSVVNVVLLRSLPYGDSGRLVYLYTPNPKLKLPTEVFGPSYGDFFDIQRQSRSFSTMTIFQQAEYSFASHDGTVRIGGARVDENFFSTLQSPPELGRAISSQDTELGHAGVVVISHALWQSMFAGNIDILTRSLQLSGRSYRIIGVMPEEFQYPHHTDVAYGNPHILTTQVWVPLALTPQQRADRNDSYGNAIARLKLGVSVAQAQAEMSTIMVRLDLLHTGDVPRGWQALVKPFLDVALGPVRPLMWLLLGTVFFVLLIACGNAANLLLARAASRTHELGVRATLGARRSRMIRQMLTESLLLGLAGGFIGIALAYVFLHGLMYLNPGNIPRLNQASLDVPVLLFSLGLSIVTSILFGILPALSASQINLVEFLKSSGSRGIVGSRNRLRSSLLAAEIGLVVILLAGAGLLLRSYFKVESIQTGFSQSTVSMDIHLDSRYRQPQQRDAFFQELIGKLSALPGVKAVGAVNGLPLSGSESLTFFRIDGDVNQKDQLIQIRAATPDYFSAMNTPLMEGRFFTKDDRQDSPPVVIVNQTFATTYFPNRNPVGQRVWTGGMWTTVVGVIGNVRLSNLEEPAQPQVYEPLQGVSAAREDSSDYIAIRSVLPPKQVASTVRAVLRAMDPNLALTDIHTMGELVSEATARRRFQTTLLTVFAAMALLLALVGFYGLLAYSVKQRTAEIGIRMALGASRTQVLIMVLSQAFWLVLVGLFFGLAGAFALTHILASSLYGVRAFDPVTFIAVPLLLLFVTLAAALIPSWRAARVDPAITLRYE